MTGLLRIALCFTALTVSQAIVSAQPPEPAQAASPIPATPSLPEVIASLLSRPDVARDHWGIAVTALDDTPIFSLNENQLFQPASNTKLFTTAAAMALLGPQRRFTTRVTGTLNPSTGIVNGDLTLIGAGDANLDSEDLPYIAPANRPKPAVPHQPNPMHDINDLVAQLVAKGVKEVRGDIVGDDTLFPWEPYPQEWSIDDAIWGYGAPVGALTIQDNELRLSIAPGATAGQPATITLEQAVPYYTVQNETRTVATKAQATGVQVDRRIGSRTLRLYGSIALDDETDVEHIAIEDPAQYAAMVLRAALLDHGIAVTGTARARHQLASDATGFLTALHAPSKAKDQPPFTDGIESTCSVPSLLSPVLATHESAPLFENVDFTNKVSQNLHAELLLHHLGGINCGNNSTAEGARVIRQFLLKAGIDPNDFIFLDGSGLSSHDLVTPRAIARLLSYAAHDPQTGQPQPWFSAWKASLPIGGEDGSLASRFPNSPLKDHVFAKTGTLGEARALSGYLDCASGRTVIFSVLDGNHLPGTSADREAIDHIVAAIQATQ